MCLGRAWPAPSSIRRLYFTMCSGRSIPAVPLARFTASYGLDCLGGGAAADCADRTVEALSLMLKPQTRGQLEHPPAAMLQVMTILMLLMLVGLQSCRSGENHRKCSDTITEGRTLVRRGEIARARQKLDRARTVCDSRQQPLVRLLDEEIGRKEAESRQGEQQAAEAARLRLEQPIVEFMNWVRDRWEAADKSEAEVECIERGRPDSGWCVARKRTDSHTFQTRYRETDSTAFRFEVVLNALLSCDDLGSHRMVRTWKSKSDAGQPLNRAYCELTDKRFRGLSALVSSSKARSEVYVFSRGFVDQDRQFRDLIRREGR
jgi:hypothetical protein